MGEQNWFLIQDVDKIDSPSLVLYKDRIVENIKRLVDSIDDVNRLRPHIKTHKSPDVSRLMLNAGIRKFKCATISEAEMLANAGATDILLAYQPVGPKTLRLAELVVAYPKVKFACLVDNLASAEELSKTFEAAKKTIDVYIDLNVGMNRTGIVPEQALTLFFDCLSLRGIRVTGLHAYDGHLRDTDFQVRSRQCDEAFKAVESLQQQILEQFKTPVTIVAGGTPTYSIHRKRKNVECSPGTFIYWDKGYELVLQEQHYLHAALVLARVISIPSKGVICTDLGHKAIASENALQNRVYFLNASDLIPTGHSEEHMVFKTATPEKYKVGDVLYGVPHHVCPTIALHDEAVVILNHKVSERWKNVSRKRKISI